MSGIKEEWREQEKYNEDEGTAMTITMMYSILSTMLSAKQYCT